FGDGLRAEQFPELPPAAFEQLERGLRVFVPLSALVFPFVWWLGVSSLMHLTVRLFGGRATFSGMLAVVGVACAPWVAGYLVQIPLSLLQLAMGDGGVSAMLGVMVFAVSAGAFVWHVVLVALGARLVAGTSPGGAAMSCALAGLGCVTAMFFLGLTLVTLAVALSRGVGGP
ncbi:MAG TPA: YIP1 family protein, partial [Rubrobacteraceae bacterium]|nr:YIP1 family protein [Rubrobacteraceae bacterium]